MLSRLPLILVSVTLLLPTCSSGSGPSPTVPAATTGTVNGVRVIDAPTYQFGFTSLDGAALVGTAILKAAAISDLSAGAATAGVCGQMQSQATITATLSLDSTRSMKDTDPTNLRAAALAFVNRMGRGDRAAVLSFDTLTPPSGSLEASYLWQEFTADRALLGTAITSATFANGGTPLYAAMIDASTFLKASGSTNPRALILTDGVDNSSLAPPDEAVRTAGTNGTPLYIIGLDAGGTLNFTAAENLATRTGGLFQKATDAAQLQPFCHRTYNAFRAQGCVQVDFTQKPATGTVVTGKLNVTVGAASRMDAVVSTPFTVTVR
ncbi:vWA domain-containing protein [Deinococcus sp.]|uniref:vWA domain-containing protein n=1 Tax=Deinococcus sp. TaxID=47478 RepID=UPI002869B95E|nr:vWA domain-containing protein [Deinococcus sp.]